MATKRKRAQKTANVLAEVHRAIADTGGEGYLKALVGRTEMYRVMGATATLEGDIILELEEKPCWRRRSQAEIPPDEAKTKWQKIPATPFASNIIASPFQRTILLSDGERMCTGYWDPLHRGTQGMPGLWRQPGDYPVLFTPVWWSPLPELPKEGV